MMSPRLGTTPGQVDPKDLSTAQLAALRMLAEYRCIRTKGGWRAVGMPLITLPVAHRLNALGLIARCNTNGAPRMQVTGIGRNTLAVADQRKRKVA